MIPPFPFLPVQIDEALPQMVTSTFLINNVELECLSASIEVAKWSGLFCDRQKVLEITQPNNGYGCYSMQTRLSNISISHSMNIRKYNIALFKVDDFSSLRFSKFYPSSLFQPTSRINLFEQIDVHDKIESCIDEMIDNVNNSDGFIIIG